MRSAAPIIGDYSNESPVSFKVRITRENKLARPDGDRVANGVIKMNDSLLVRVIVPGGVSTATFDLLWHRDWSIFPTSDIDMYLFNPSFDLTSVEGATSNAPERAIIENPTPGTWYVLIDGHSVDKSDNFDLYMKLEYTAADPYDSPMMKGEPPALLSLCQATEDPSQ